jgi:hypothetical protein
MDAYYATPVPPFPTALGAAFNTFTTRQDISPQPLPIIYPGQLRIGSKIKVEAEGEFSTTGTPTLSIGTYIGTIAGVITTVIAEYTAAATGSAAASWPWRLEWRGIVTAVGTAGSVTGCGAVELGSSLVAATTLPIPSTLALRTIAWDTTIARAIGVCATWGTSSASNSIKTYNSSVLLLN